LHPFPFLAQATTQPEEGAQQTQTTESTQAPGTADPAQTPVKKEAPSLFSGPWIPLLLGIVVLYFFVFRSKRNEDRKRQDMLAALKRGDRVVTIGGIIGNVIEANDHNVLLKVDESSNTKMRFTRSAIHRVLTDEKTEAK
jgi:preprotein translocase subunit YajC